MNKPTVYFFCKNEPYNYQHDIVIIAEGLKKLGIDFYSNTDYWKENIYSDDYLFKHNKNVNPKDCDIIIYPYSYFYKTNPDYSITIYNINSREYQNFKGILIYLDSNDQFYNISSSKEFQQFDLILKSHFNKKCKYPENFRPWTFGLPYRIIKRFENIKPFESRKPEILSNFAASHGYEHQLRAKMKIEFYPLINKQYKINQTIDELFNPPSDPYEKLMWNQCWGRYNENYFKRIEEVQMQMAFCGFLIPNLPFNPFYLNGGGNKNKIYKSLFSLTSKIQNGLPRLIQWDSWRFWESLAAGCVPIHIDLEKYGVELPIMPINWKHYIGINLKNIKEDVDRLTNKKNTILEISKAGKKWAMENYSPQEMAKRLLKLSGYEI